MNEAEEKIRSKSNLVSYLTVVQNLSAFHGDPALCLANYGLNNMSGAKGDLRKLLEENLSLRNEIVKELDGLFQALSIKLDTEDGKYVAERVKLLENMIDYFNRLMKEFELPQAANKIKFNISNKAIYQLFKDLMQIKTEETAMDGTKLPILSSTSKSIARFIKANVEGFEDVKVGNIESELRRTQEIKKGKVEVSWSSQNLTQ